MNNAVNTADIRTILKARYCQLPHLFCGASVTFRCISVSGRGDAYFLWVSITAKYYFIKPHKNSILSKARDYFNMRAHTLRASLWRGRYNKRFAHR